MRKLRCAAEAAVGLVKHFQSRFDNFLNYLRRKLASFAGEGFSIRDRTLDHLCLLEHIAILLVISVGDRQQHALEAWPAPVLRGRKIRASEERLAIGGQEGRQRPAALPADGLHRRLVTAVYVGPLVTVNLYGDEALVDQLCQFRIFIRLAIHHMTPMAPDRANIEQDGFVFALGFVECLCSPLMPLNWLVHGRAQVRRRGVRE